jgi:hypothetical protein
MSVARLNAQDLVDNGDQPEVRGANGLQFYGITAGFGYSSLGALAGVGQNVSGLGGEGYALGSISVGYSHYRPRSTFNVIYSPSYVDNFGFAQFSAFNQSLGISLGRQLNTKWSWSLSGSGEYSTIDQFLFNQQAGSIPTAGSSGTLGPETTPPLTALLYGSRVLMLSGNTGAAYQRSPRLRFYFGSNVTRAQGINNTPNSGIAGVYPATTSEAGISTIAYSLTPRSDIGLDSTFTNVNTAFGNYLITTILGTYGHKLDRHWSYLVGLGVSSFVLRTSTTNGASSGNAITLATTDSIRYDTRTQRLALTYTRAAGDSYGLASTSSDLWTFSWTLNQLRGGWGLNAIAAFQRYATGPSGTVDFWQLSSAVTHTIGRNATMSLSYAYMKEVLGPTYAIPNQSVQSVQLTISWNPFARGRQALRGGEAAGAVRN